jgi:hypothetical protein
MSDPNHTESMDQIHSSEREIDALQNKINESNDSTTAYEYAAMRHGQERHRQLILQRKSQIDRNKWAE